MAFFSIITITRNNLAGLKKTYESLMNQSCDDYEWIVIDGNSSDSTLTLLETTDANWISEPDQGIYDAMNKGIERAKGSYLIFLNAGDILHNNKTLELVKNAIKNEDFIYGDSFEGPHHKPARLHTQISKNMFTHHQAMFYKRTKIGKLKYNLKYKIAADYDFTAQFIKKIDTVKYIANPICNFKPGGISQTNAKTGRIEQFKIRKNLNLTALPTNILYYFAQTFLWTFRIKFQSAYWLLKSKPTRSEHH